MLSKNLYPNQSFIGLKEFFQFIVENLTASEICSNVGTT